MIEKVDRFGLCPNCRIPWDGGDIYDYLNSLSVSAHKSQAEIKHLAGLYGWTEFNKTKFSKVKVIVTGEKTYYQCPNLRCGHVWDIETGKEYDSLYSIKDEEEDEPEVMAEVKTVVEKEPEEKVEDWGEIDDLETVRKFFEW